MEFQPTLFFGFQLVKGEQLLHQMWVNQQGLSEWRPVPVIQEGPQTKRPDAIAGYVPEDQE